MNLQARAINILSKPKQEWPVIASESTDVAALYGIHHAVGGHSCDLRISWNDTDRCHHPAGGSDPNSYGQWFGRLDRRLCALSGLAAFIVDKLAPSFQSSGGIVHGLKMVAFASTPSWVAGVLQLVPLLAALALLAALYGIYIFYLGLPFVMKTPPDKVIPYMVVSAIVIIVISVVTATISGIFMGASRLM